MKAQHTPGPWWAGKHRNSDNVVDQIIISDNETNYRIAGLNVSNHGRKEEEQTANALLIAAAPELLEACRQIVWKLSHNHQLPDYKGPARITREDATVKMAIAAIARAEGGEPMC